MAYSKYRNKKIVLDGHKFDSKAEANRYWELKLLEKRREIIDLKLQPKFKLMDGFRRKGSGKAIRAIHYIADFKYISKSGLTVVEDVKGKRTAEYQIKKKLFLRQHPEIIFVEIHNREEIRF